jgi:hypothetical protein
MNAELTVETTMHFGRGRRGEKTVRPGPVVVRATGRIPRISRLMALAIRFDELVRTGQVSSYAELARLGHVSPARVTHIMNLNLLAPAIQEWLLFLPRIESGPEPVCLKDLQGVARVVEWDRQRIYCRISEPLQ